MKKCLTERDNYNSLMNKNNSNRTLIISDNNKRIIPKIKLTIPFNNKKKFIVINKKIKNRMNTNFLTNKTNTLSNNENTNPNNNNTPLSFLTKIYQKKKIPCPPKVKEKKEKEKINKINTNIKKYIDAKIYNSINNFKKLGKINNSKIKKSIKNNTLNERINSSKGNKININNININLNNIKNITNKFEIADIHDLKTSRSNYNNNFNTNNINDTNFLKKLNFDQPRFYNLPKFETLVDNKSNGVLSNKILLNNRINHKSNYIYKNYFSNLNIKHKSKIKNLTSAKSKLINSLTLIPHSEKKSKKIKNSNNSKNNSNKNKNIITTNNKSNKNQNKEKIESNLITSESLTILDNSISEINSFINESNDITQLESEKDDKNNILSTHQLNLYLNMAKRFHYNCNNNNSNTIIKQNKKKLELNNFIFSSINTNFKLNLIKFLDKKSLLVLSSINKKFFTNLRSKIYKYFYDKIIKNNGNKVYILKILSSLKKYSSNKNKYYFYLKKKSLYDNIIMQDIVRTFPCEKIFGLGSNNYNKLYNILTAYSNFNKNIGYAQGMNFIVARAISAFKNEEKVFDFLDGFINRFNLGYLISINNQKLPNQMKYFSHILNKYCSDFINYLKSKLVSPDFFSTSWLLTLFSNSMDKKKLYICWCFMIIFGWKFFYSFVIQVILFYEKSLIKINESKLSKQMKDLLKSNSFIQDFNQIVKNTLVFMENNIIL